MHQQRFSKLDIYNILKKKNLGKKHLIVWSVNNVWIIWFRSKEYVPLKIKSDKPITAPPIGGALLLAWHLIKSMPLNVHEIN